MTTDKLLALVVWPLLQFFTGMWRYHVLPAALMVDEDGNTHLHRTRQNGDIDLYQLDGTYLGLQTIMYPDFAPEGAPTFLPWEKEDGLQIRQNLPFIAKFRSPRA